MTKFPLPRISIFLLLVLGLAFAGCQKKLHLVKSDPRYYTVDGESDRTSSTELQQLLGPYQDQFNKTMNDVIGVAANTMKKDKPESTLGNWMCDVILEKAREVSGVHVDIAIQNYGGIRIPELAKGDITRSKIYELMPFDNMLVIVECPGEVMQVVLQKMIDGRGMPVSGSLHLEADENNKPTNVTIDGQPFDPNKTYHIALPDYVANGGDRSDFYIDLKKYDTGVFIRDLLIEGVEEAEVPIESKLDGRITLKQ